MKPLLEVLKAKGIISYRWKFPFALQATFNGKQFTLRTPDELLKFCENMQLAPVDLPEWYAEFMLPPAYAHQPLSQKILLHLCHPTIQVNIGKTPTKAINPHQRLNIPDRGTPDEAFLLLQATRCYEASI